MTQSYFRIITWQSEIVRVFGKPTEHIFSDYDDALKFMTTGCSNELFHSFRYCDKYTPYRKETQHTNLIIATYMNYMRSLGKGFQSPQ